MRTKIPSWGVLLSIIIRYIYIYIYIYWDIDQVIDVLAHATDNWTLYDNAPLLSENPKIRSNEEFNEWILQDTQQIVQQRLLDESEYHFV